MKKSPSKKHTLYKNPILIGSILLNVALIIGLYLFFRPNIVPLSQPTLATQTTNPSDAQIQPEQIRTVAKNVPLSATQVELISQNLPDMGHSASSVAVTQPVTVLPTLLEPATSPSVTAKTATDTTPIAMTKIVRIPQEVSSSATKSDKRLTQGTAAIASQNSPHSTVANPNQPTATTNEQLLTERDIPANTATLHTHDNGATSQRIQGSQRELEAKTAQLSEAINQVKRLNQQAIDEAQRTQNSNK